MRAFTTHTVAAGLCFSLLLVSVLASETFTTKFGKRQIPVDLITRALQPHSNDVGKIDLSRVVYEIHDGNLVGFNLNLNIEDDTTVRPPSPSKSLKYTLNGNERLLPPSPTVRHAKGYTFLHRASDDRLIHVFGNGLNLKTLDTVYPDVFVNTLATDPTSETSTDAVEVAKRIAVRNNIALDLQNSTARQTGSCTAAGTTRFLELAVAFDNQFCALHSNDESIATAAVQTLVNQADEVFREFTCISVALVHIEAHCNDPADPYAFLSDFSLAEPGEVPSSFIQRGFRDFWEQFRTDVRRDAAYFLSGFDDGSNTAGRAGIGATCNAFAYGWSEGISLTVFIHEIGHIVGSNHTPDGIMIATGFRGGEIFFSQASIDMISSYVDSTPEDCLSVSAPTCDTTCSGPCVNGQCIARFSSLASPGVVPCSTNFRCVNSEVHFSTEYFFADVCPTNFRYVSREASETSNLDTFCCMAATASVTSGVAPADFQFIQFTLNLPDGPIVYPEYIQDPSVVETRTLLQTELLPSCQLTTGAAAPPPEQVPALSPQPTEPLAPTPTPAFVSETPQPTPVFVEPKAPKQSDTPSVTEEPTGPQSGDLTCGGALTDSETFTCESSVAEQINVFISSNLVYAVTVQLIQRNGMFKATLQAPEGVKIRGVAAKLSTDGGLGSDDIGPVVLNEDMTSMVTIEEDAFEMDLPDGASTCCGESLFLYVQLEICPNAECVTRGLFKRETEIVCSEPCESSPGGTVVPFSETNECPSCLE